MQQIFVLVNKLLQSDPSTSKRKLGVRTYKVIPLTQRSGVVEWCEGTRPMGEYLVGTMANQKSGAHSRYRPFDWTSLSCRKKMIVSAETSRN
jgi:ataxia telangiectasia mutated family protein